MSPTRRNFLVSGAAAAVSGTAGCGRSGWLEAFRLPQAPALVPFPVPGGEEADDVAHLLRRCTFGAAPGDYGRVRSLAEDPREAALRFLDEQLEPASDRFADWVCRRFEIATQNPIGEFFEFKPEHILRDALGMSLVRAVVSTRQLHELMVQFWSDHFNIDSSKGDCRWLFAWDQREVVRQHALGRFRDLLGASARSPAMLWYLDGRVNEAGRPEDKPNENYARELLELHTLGVHGGYTQRDVMEVARCLSGWTVRERGREFLRIGEAEFRAGAHDDGEKEVLGQRIPAGGGAADLDRVLDLVAGHPSTARHLGFKLCRRFISEEPPEEAVAAVAAAFTESGGSISATLRTLFRTSAFWDNRGNKFKRPFHFVASALRGLGASDVPVAPLVDFLQRMGHVPFQYPTPDGYPEDAAPWLSGLMWRWRFAFAVAGEGLKGARVDLERLTECAGGSEALACHLIGRRPRAGAAEVWAALDHRPEAVLASPDFQWF